MFPFCDLEYRLMTGYLALTGTSMTDLRALSAPLGDAIVMTADFQVPEHINTEHGAVVAGRRAAEKILSDIEWVCCFELLISDNSLQSEFENDFLAFIAELSRSRTPLKPFLLWTCTDFCPWKFIFSTSLFKLLYTYIVVLFNLTNLLAWPLQQPEPIPLHRTRWPGART
jgi:hypothetical protein